MIVSSATNDRALGIIQDTLPRILGYCSKAILVFLIKLEVYLEFLLGALESAKASYGGLRSERELIHYSYARWATYVMCIS